MKVIFRVDASLKMGTGRVIYCLTSAQVLKENSVNVEFICRQYEGNLVDKVRSIGFNVYELESLEENEVDNKLSHSFWLKVAQQQDAGDCIDILKSAIINWQYNLKLFYKKIMAIDGLADRKYQCDILIGQAGLICI